MTNPNNSKYIIVKGARQHNLKNIDVKIPRDKLVVFTGLSGSGKSSLAIDTIYAEGQRRYLQSLSAYARQFLEGMDKPDVDYIEGLSPAIAIEQKTVSKNPRSTVGTVTEIYDYLRLLWANIGIPHCPICRREITPKSSQEIIHEILQSLNTGTKFKILAPMVRGKKGTYEKLFLKLQKSGYSRIMIQDQGKEAIEYLLEEPINLDRNIKHDIDVIVDRLIMKTEEDDEFRSRVANSIETSLKLAEGLVKISIVNGDSKIFSEHFFCPECGVSYEKLQARDFSFNTPYGMCEFCKGLGTVLNFDEAKIFPDTSVNLYDSGLTRVGGFGSINSWSWKTIEALAEYYNVDITQSIDDLPDEFWNKFLYGTGKEKISFNFERNGGYDSQNEEEEDEDEVHFSVRYKRPFKGIITILQNRYLRTKSQGMREWYEQFMREYECSACKGKRLKPVSLAVTINDKNIWEVSRMYVSEAIRWFNCVKLSKRERTIAKEILKEIHSRYFFLENVGLDYISLDRVARTLSGGESERIRLATQIGSNLVGVLYVLDEPTIGLHPRDKSKLINMLIELKKRGNTVLIVEHDEDVIRAADFIVDIGPFGGEKGGEIVETGNLETVMNNPRSITGRYLSGKEKICLPKSRRPLSESRIRISGARENNLKSVTAEIPLGVFTCVTGVSGAGKSSLVQEVLLNAVEESLRRKKKGLHIKYDTIEGLEYIDKIINIDQSPIGRTPKSVPATYTKAFDYIRDTFAKTEEAKIRGYEKGRFSFNTKAGRCEKCGGLGYNLIEMHFLPDVYVKCDVCQGQRYNEETLEVKYKGKNIYEVLRMTHNQALEFFENNQKINEILQTVVDVGLGYIELGQSSTTLSGGEAQRMKLSRELSKRSTGNTLFLLDEPTTGLHFHDVKILIKALQRLVDQGNSVVVIEHNLDIIKSADYIIDLGPEGGENGGEIIASGTPEEIAVNDRSYTGKYLRKVLSKLQSKTNIDNLQEDPIKTS
ncbi:MAG: excinuclease ABC subunit UvrA [Candidatus Lokiarchaeota archaeon]|nr:excinuclease ABC subunit UvrA [Candidatus Lokiarchaeota archaeon]